MSRGLMCEIGDDFKRNDREKSDATLLVEGSFS